MTDSEYWRNESLISFSTGMSMTSRAKGKSVGCCGMDDVLRVEDAYRSGGTLVRC
jgi:hypothetical protein